VPADNLELLKQYREMGAENRGKAKSVKGLGIPGDICQLMKYTIAMPFSTVYSCGQPNTTIFLVELCGLG
jgi:hypothetical protein